MAFEPMEISSPKQMDIKASGTVIGQLIELTNSKYSIQFTQRADLTTLVPLVQNYFKSQNREVSAMILDMSDELIIVETKVVFQPRKISDNPQA